MFCREICKYEKGYLWGRQVEVLRDVYFRKNGYVLELGGGCRGLVGLKVCLSYLMVIIVFIVFEIVNRLFQKNSKFIYLYVDIL